MGKIVGCWRKILNTFVMWLYMGGYANYVWSAYGLVFAVLMLNSLGIRWQRKRIIRSLETWFKQTST